MKPGIYPGLPWPEYEAIDAVNNSLLKAASKSPRHGWEYLHLPRPEPTADMQYGSLFHAAVLEPHALADLVAVRPDEIGGKPWHGNRKECKEWLSEHRGAAVMAQGEYDAIRRDAENLKGHPHVAWLLSCGDAECTAVAQHRDHPETLLKCRMDWYSESRGIIADIKTMKDASNDALSREIAKWGLHRQAAFYIDVIRWLGKREPDFYFIAYEKGDRPKINCRKLDTDSIEQGRREYDRILSRWLQACREQDWPGYDEGADMPGEIGLPRWAFDRLEDVELEGAEVQEHALMGGSE